MIDRLAVVSSREGKRDAAKARRHDLYMARVAARVAAAPPAAPGPGEEPDDDIPEGEAEARKAIVREAKRAKQLMGLCPDLAESELEAVLPE